MTRNYSIEQSPSAARWASVIQSLYDANIYQTFGYGQARVGRDNLSHLIVTDGKEAVAAVQARIIGLPMFRIGMAYIRWGPMWRRKSGEQNEEEFGRAVRAVREEYAGRRGLIVRMLPALLQNEGGLFREILLREGFQPSCQHQNFRTILMDLRPSLNEIEQGCHQKWRKNLNRARKNNLEIIEGSDTAYFDSLESIYREMVARKGFEGSSDIHIYKRAQERLQHSERMRVILCKSEGEIVAGALCSGLGRTGIDLFRATSDKGVRSFGSFLVQWKVVEYLKQHGCQWYNLNSINPVANPGGYQFKSQMAGKNGRDVSFIGAFDAYPSAAKKLLLNFTQRYLTSLKELRLTRRNRSRSDAPPAPALAADPRVTNGRGAEILESV